MSQTTLRIRRSLLEVQADYENGNKKPLEDLMRAWKGIKELPHDNPKSFFKLGGYHGEPFRGPGTTSSAYWGGYCNHGNVLFPTWHRVYLVKLEEALQSIPGCSDVMLPYWDETSEESLNNGIPWALTVRDFVLDGLTIPNPLRSFFFPVSIVDQVDGDKSAYNKPQGYETVRYPLSGLVGTAEAQAETDKHNSLYPDYDKNVDILNGNITGWMNNTVVLPAPTPPRKIGVNEEFKRCLKAPNYTVFSNTTSAGEWNQANADNVVPLESPHNHIHLAVGGFDVPGQGNFSPIADANGDMGENDTAGLDPIFYFHHCNIDRVFWLWQKRTGNTDELEIIPFYPGTNSSDSQGPTPGFPPNTILDINSPLYPFLKTNEAGKQVSYTSQDCINIEKQLDYTYSLGSLEGDTQEIQLMAGASTKKVLISGINRAEIKGSFVVSAFANIDGEKHLIGYQSVLSRWNVKRCSNCLNHVEVKAAFDLHSFTEDRLTSATYHVEIKSRRQESPTAALTEKKLYHLEIR